VQLTGTRFPSFAFSRFPALVKLGTAGGDSKGIRYKLTEQREIAPYKWVHPDEDRYPKRAAAMSDLGANLYIPRERRTSTFRITVIICSATTSLAGV
jgi:hypothetical protein